MPRTEDQASRKQSFSEYYMSNNIQNFSYSSNMAIFQKFAVVKAGIEISIGQTYCSTDLFQKKKQRREGG
jgi:hypothetical protein